MSRLEPAAYLDHIRSESRRFRDVLADCDPLSKVPSCPDWTADDLLWHLATVQHWWARMVRERPAPPDDYQEPGRPASHGELLEAYDEWSAALTSALESADPKDAAWTWHPDEANHHVGWILRRQAHEALIHRVDAEQAAGLESELDARLAADGVDEVLDVMYGGCPPWGEWSPLDHYVRIDLTDVDESVWCRLGHFHGTPPESEEVIDEDDFHVVPDPGLEPDAIIEATAAEMDLRLWKRGTGDSIHLAGDRSLIARFRQATHSPIN